MHVRNQTVNVGDLAHVFHRYDYQEVHSQAEQLLKQSMETYGRSGCELRCDGE